MAKKSSTVYLEQIFWDMITDYQNTKNLSSRNDALQLILQEWDILRKIDFNNININIADKHKPIVDTVQVINEPEEQLEVKQEETVDPRIANGIFKIASTMKTDE